MDDRAQTLGFAYAHPNLPTGEVYTSRITISRISVISSIA